MKGSIKEKLLLILGSSFLVVLLGLLVYDVARRGIYRGDMGMNIAVAGEKGMGLLLLRPEEEMVSWVDIPDEVSIQIYNSPASYPIGSLWSYGVGEKRPYEIVEKSLGRSMGVVIAKTMRMESKGSVENVLGSLLSLGLKTDLSFRDRLLIRKFLAESVKSKKMLELNLPDNVFDKVTDPDGKESLVFNNVMSLWSKNKFVLEPLLIEGASVSVNNVSGTEGLGLLLSKQLESSGVHVIEVKADKSENVGGQGCFYSSGSKHEMTVTFLREQLGCKKTDMKTYNDDEEKILIWVK